MRLNQGSIGSVAVTTISDSITRLVGVTREEVLKYLRAGQAYHYGALVNAVAANYTHAQLYNPTGSGKTVIVTRVRASRAALDGLNVTQYDTQLATDVGTGQPLLAGGAAGLAHIRTGQNAAQLGTAFVRQRGAADTPVDLLKGWCYEMPETKGLVIVPDTVNVATYYDFEWVEF